MTPAQQSARKAAQYASRLDFHLMGASSDNLTQEQRDENLRRAFRKLVSLLPHMRDLKAQRPDLYQAAEDELRQAQEITGRAA